MILMNLLSKNKKSITSFFLLLLFIIFFIIKYRFFVDLFPGIDQAFYIKWIIDLANSKNFFPVGNNSFYLNLISDNNSFLHNYFRRIYNDVGVIYNVIPLFLNLIFAKIGNYNVASFNTLSIFFNCLIPLFITIHLLEGKKLTIKEHFYASTLHYLFISSFFSIFFFAPHGIHNYSLLFLIISVIIFERNIKKINFLNFHTIIYGILIPCFSHKFNIIIIFLSIFLILILRFFNNLRIKKDLIITILLFFIILSPMFIFTFIGERNIELLKIFFLGKNELAEESFISTILNYISINTINSFKIFSINLWNNLGLFGIILFLISLFNKKFIIIKVFIISTFLLFIFLPLSPYIGRLFNYFLILSIFLICNYFSNFLIGKKKVDRLMQTLLIITILVNFLPLVFNNMQNNFQNKLANKYQNNDIWNKKINKIIEIVGNENILFYQYLARDVYYSNYNKIDNIKNIYSTPSIYDLSTRYMNDDNQYLEKITFDKNKFKNTYVLFFGKTEFEKGLDKRFCYLQKIFFGSCSNLQIVNYSDIKKPLKYDGDSHILVLNLYKSID